jgi:hypothetical protein
LVPTVGFDHRLSRRAQQNAKRYVWHAKGEDILRKVEAARQALAVIAAAEC